MRNWSRLPANLRAMLPFTGRFLGCLFPVILKATRRKMASGLALFPDWRRILV